MIKAYAHMAAPFYHALGYIYLMEGQRHESEAIFYYQNRYIHCCHIHIMD